MKRFLLSFWLATAIAAAAGRPRDAEPLSIARQGYFFAGGKYSNHDNRTVMSGQLYVDFQIPSKQTHPWPVVMIHGGGQTGTNFTGTPDGREGWAQFFLRQGYAVYVVDQPGRGRAAYEAETYGPMTRLDADNIRPSTTIFGRRPTCIRSGPARARPETRCSINSTRRRCLRFRTSRCSSC